MKYPVQGNFRVFYTGTILLMSQCTRRSFKMIVYGFPPRPRWQVRLATPYLLACRYGLRWLARLARRLRCTRLAGWLVDQRARSLLRWHAWVNGDGRLLPWTHTVRGRLL